MKKKSLPKYWLMKSEPDVYSVDDLAREGSALWDGVRNYQARNFMRDEMSEGDRVLFYHSNATPPGVAGLAHITKTGVPDPTAFDKKSKYFDPKSDPSSPRWICVELKHLESFKNIFSLQDIKDDNQLSDMLVAKRGQRLSVQPVEKKHFDRLLKLSMAKDK